MRKSEKFTVLAGSSAVVALMHGGRLAPVTVVAAPGAGGAALVETSHSPTAIASPGTAVWLAWDAGSVSAATARTLYADAIAVRLTATTQTAVFEVASK